MPGMSAMPGMAPMTPMTPMTPMAPMPTMYPTGYGTTPNNHSRWRKSFGIHTNGYIDGRMESVTTSVSLSGMADSNQLNYVILSFELCIDTNKCRVE